jgi:hypothetical protein
MRPWQPPEDEVPLCGSLAESGYDKVYVDSGAGKHVHQSIDTKQIDPPANDIADPRLPDTKELGRFHLGEAAIFDYLAHGDHEGRSDSEVLGFSLIEAKVPEHVPAGWGDLRFHR